MNDSKLTGTVCVDSESKGQIEFDYDLSVFAKDPSVYDHELSRLSCKLVRAGYDRITDDPSAKAQTGHESTQKGVKAMLEAMDFTGIEINPRVERDEESYFFASRVIQLDGSEYDLFVAAFIGSYQKTWYSNFDPLGVDRICNGGKGYAGDAEKGSVHLGFADAREYTHEKLRAFITKNRTGRPVKLLITGHSRGAATAGLLAAKLIVNGGFGDGVTVGCGDIFTYCFATPNYADTEKTDVKDERFAQIFNIVSPEDFVTEVFPAASGFGRYGTVYSFFGPDNLSRDDYAREKAVMTRFFIDYRSSRPYAPYKNGNRSVTGIIAVMAKSMSDIDVFYNKKMRLCFKSCTPYEYFRDTLCAFIGGSGSPEDQAKKDRATKLLIGSALDLAGTSAPLRRISGFFVFKQGMAGATGGKLGDEYFNDAHIIETYLAYLMSMREEQLIRTQ